MLVVQMTKFDSIESLDQILFVCMLQIWNLGILGIFGLSICRH